MKLRNALVTFAIVTLSPVVWANETYKFDLSGSTIGFTVHQFLGTTHGKFTKFEGKIDIDREHPEKSSVVAKIDVASINTGIVKRDNHLRSPEFFNVAKFPEITFKSRIVLLRRRRNDLARKGPSTFVAAFVSNAELRN